MQIGSRNLTSPSEVVAALADSNLRFDTLVEALPEIVWSTARHGNHDFFSRGWIEFTGTRKRTTIQFDLSRWLPGRPHPLLLPSRP